MLISVLSAFAVPVLIALNTVLAVFIVLIAHNGNQRAKNNHQAWVEDRLEQWRFFDRLSRKVTDDHLEVLAVLKEALVVLESEPGTVEAQDGVRPAPGRHHKAPLGLDDMGLFLHGPDHGPDHWAKQANEESLEAEKFEQAGLIQEEELQVVYGPGTSVTAGKINPYNVVEDWHGKTVTSETHSRQVP
jgi:hypothetical protein